MIGGFTISRGFRESGKGEGAGRVEGEVILKSSLSILMRLFSGQG